MSVILVLLGTLMASSQEISTPPEEVRHREPEELLMAAHTAYDSRHWATAAQLYEQLIGDGVDNGHLHYNLGNAELRAGRIGRAIVAYRMGESKMPRNQDLRANLSFARKLAKDAIAPVEPTPVLRTLFFWHFGFSLREILTLLVTANLLFWGTLTLLLYRRESEILRWAAVGTLLVVLMLGVSAAIRTVLPREVAVTLKREVNVHSGTTRDTVVRFKLHEGTETSVLDSDNNWVRIALPDGKQGWVERGDVQVIAI